MPSCFFGTSLSGAYDGARLFWKFAGLQMGCTRSYRE